MSPAQRFEKESSKIFKMNNAQLKQQIKRFRGSFKLDFSDSYLNNQSTDRLRHILIAAVTTRSGKCA